MSILFSIVAVSIYIPTNSARGFGTAERDTEVQTDMWTQGGWGAWDELGD